VEENGEGVGVCVVVASDGSEVDCFIISGSGVRRVEVRFALGTGTRIVRGGVVPCVGFVLGVSSFGSSH
jgi:hypothetical protein